MSAPFRWVASPRADSTGKVLDADAIRILDGWPEREITSWHSTPVYTRTGRTLVTLNHAVRADFDTLWAAWEASGVLDALHGVTYDGDYVPRYKRGLQLAHHDQQARHLSNHASGHAFDICASHYPLGVRIGVNDPMRAVASVARETGRWRVGGDFTRPDWMHYEHVTSPF